MSLVDGLNTFALMSAWLFSVKYINLFLSVIQVLLLLNYFVSFYVIFHHVSQNLLLLREQLSFIEDEDVHAMHDAIYTKYTMFKYVTHPIDSSKFPNKMQP